MIDMEVGRKKYAPKMLIEFIGNDVGIFSC